MCYNPITIKTPSGYQKVPCGHCLECLRQYQNSWSNRMYEEIKAHNGKAVFFTLTYNDESVPKNYLVDGNIYRSYSDYAYDNTIIRFVGKKTLKPKICSIVNGERVKEGVPADKVLTDLGIYGDKISFNNPKHNEKFIHHVQRIYGDYLRLVSSTLPFSSVNGTLGVDLDSLDEWFDNYEGDLFLYDDINDTTEEFREILNDNEDSSNHTFSSFCDSISNIDFVGTLSGDELSSQREEKRAIATEGLPSVAVPIAQDTFINTEVRPRPIMEFNSVRKEDIIKWLNRGLNKVKRNFGHGFKWFVTSEYGPRTLRPHYHGILFGVTKEEAQCMFSDWNRHFGFSKIDNVDITKGGTSYCAKYCAKGLYEHPLCSRDFFYMHKDGKFTEYHSKHYERCLEIFGIDEPIVDKTFHLVSKGLGLSYVDNVKDYMLQDFTDINFAPEDATPTINITRDTLDNFIEYLEIDTVEKKQKYIETYKIRRKNKDTYEKQFRDAMDTFVQRFRYNKVTPKGEVLSYAMPQYYRAKILSDGLRCALAAYVREVNDNVYREKLEAVQSNHPTWEDNQVVFLLEAESQAELDERKRKARRNFEKQLNKSKI